MLRSAANRIVLSADRKGGDSHPSQVLTKHPCLGPFSFLFRKLGKNRGPEKPRPSLAPVYLPRTLTFTILSRNLAHSLDCCQSPLMLITYPFGFLMAPAHSTLPPCTQIHHSGVLFPPDKPP
ncbi:unnamed protein product [Rangifer tarandus platyrhynchus]|uniref:Uncharacterized protein n=1 Tax=Rangifer tarandus platyrhynchus TaxID=3082113 RepID=A0AC60A7C0_RANTA